MQNYKILFTRPYVAELVESDLDTTLTGNKVLVQTEYTAISAGTERDNLRDEPNLNSQTTDPTPFPKHYGYSGVARVLKTGPDCTRVKEGQRVIVYFGNHSKYNIFSEDKLFPVLFDDIHSKVASLLVIAGFPAEGVRKTRLEFGESAMVMGLGILGLIAIQLCRIAGAVPVIAVDPNPKRRDLAIKLGADYALDPREPSFYDTVKKITDNRGADVVIDVAGNATATTQGMACLNKFGRISLLGCTRHHGEYDLYHHVHGKGVSIIGANNFARPKFESRPGNWTAYDDIYGLQKLIHGGRLDLEPLIHEIHSPLDAPMVYERLISSDDFPIGVLFDWNRLEDQ